jgi:predicted hydrocarbon binding protein
MTNSSTQMVGVAIPTLRELRAAVLASGDADTAVNALREAGYAGGDSVHAAFEQWLAELASSELASGHELSASGFDAGNLTLEEFGERTTRFFHDAGWGDATFESDDAEGVAYVEIRNCWEAGDSTHGTGCQITTGLLAAFFGRVAGYPVAVLETECAGGNATACRFMLGNADVMNYKWQEMQ